MNFVLEIMKKRKYKTKTEIKFYQSLLDKNSNLKWKRKFQLIYKKIQKEKLTKSLKNTINESFKNKENFIKTWKEHLKELKKFEKLGFFSIKDSTAFEHNTIIGMFLYSYFCVLYLDLLPFFTDEAFLIFEEIYTSKNVKTNLLVKNSEGILTSFLILSLIEDEKFVSKVLKKCEVEFDIKKHHKTMYLMPELFNFHLENFKFIINKIGKPDFGYFQRNSIPNKICLSYQPQHLKSFDTFGWFDYSFHRIEKLDLLCKISDGECLDPSKSDYFNIFTIIKYYSSKKYRNFLKSLVPLYKKYNMFKFRDKYSQTLDIFLANTDTFSLDFIYTEFQIQPQLKLYLEFSQPYLQNNSNLNYVYNVVKIMMQYNPEIKGFNIKKFQEDNWEISLKWKFVSIVQMLLQILDEFEDL